MSNALNLVVNFKGVDKLSGSIRNIIAPTKAANQSIRALREEEKKLKIELKDVNAAYAKSSGNMTWLINRQSELESAIARTNRQMQVQRDRIARIDQLRARAGKIAGAAGIGGAVATATVTAPLVAFGREAFRAAMDAEELRSAFYVTFGDKGAMMEQWAQKTGTALNRTSVELMQSANTFGIFFNQADPKKAAALSQQFAVLAQDLSSFYNVDPGTALDKLRSGLTGESEPLRDFGVFMTEAAVKAQALKMGLKPVGKEFTEQQKIMARAGLIMAQTKAAQGDLARTSGSTANQLRASQTAWQNLSLVIGRDLIPALMPAIQTITDLIKSFSSLSPGMRKFIVIAGIGAAAVGPLLIGIAGIASAVGVLAPLLAGAGAGVAMFLGVWLPLGAAIGFVAYQIYQHWDQIKAKFWEGVSWVKNLLISLPGFFRTAGGQMMLGLLASLNPALLVARLLDVARQGITAFRNYFGIKSPSRLMMQMGGHIATGLGHGIDAGAGKPLRAMGRLATGVAGAGALSLAGPGLATAAPRGAQAAPAAPVTIHIHQQPGENAEALAQRVAKVLERRSGGSRGSYRDDF